MFSWTIITKLRVNQLELSALLVGFERLGSKTSRLYTGIRTEKNEPPWDTVVLLQPRCAGIEHWEVGFPESTP